MEAIGARRSPAQRWGCAMRSPGRHSAERVEQLGRVLPSGIVRIHGRPGPSLPDTAVQVVRRAGWVSCGHPSGAGIHAATTVLQTQQLRDLPVGPATPNQP